jgi:type II secretory pathway pseudopilin PulG
MERGPTHVAVGLRTVAGRAGGRRGGILLEILLAVAIFAGAGVFALASVKSVFAALDRARREQALVDLARTRMAELEAGFINLSDVRGETPLAAGDRLTPGGANEQINDHARGESSPWSIDVRTSRTEFSGLSLVELTVTERSLAMPDRLSFTLRQLMPLREEGRE